MGMKKISIASLKKINFPVVIEEGEDGYFVAHCPILQGCHTQGKTYEEALANIKEAIELCLDVMDVCEVEIDCRPKGKTATVSA